MLAILATNNKNKIREIEGILEHVRLPEPVEVIPASAFGDIPDPDEFADSLRGNAAIKLDAYRRALRLLGAPGDAMVFAEDSGLFVDVLDGNPGVHSARWASDHNAQTNNRRLVQELHIAQATQSAGYYKAVVAFGEIQDMLNLRFESGHLQVLVRDRGRGRKGFAYDPFTYIDNEGSWVSLGEISPRLKNKISHRTRAWRAALTSAIQGL